MTFAWPHLLWLLVIPGALLLAEVTRVRRANAVTLPKILRGRAGGRALELLPARPATSGRERPRFWLALGLALTVVALARPQYGNIEDRVFDQSREILLAVDLSKSMRADDVKPTRLARAKLLIQALLERLQGERVGLVVFSGTAFLQSPLSSDYEILNEFLPMLDPDYLPAGGSNYGAMLDAAADAFGSESNADRFLIVLGDGEATDENWQDHVAALKAKGVRVIGLGVGTAAGAMIPDGNGGFVKDERGAVVMSKLDSGTLQELARETGGTYRDASEWVDLSQLLQQTVDAGRQGTFLKETRLRHAERFQWVLAPALFLLLISYWREFPVRPKPRELHLAPPRPTAAPGIARATTLLLAFLALLAPRPRLVAAAIETPAPTSTPATESTTPQDPVTVAAAPLSQAVARMSAQSQHSALDWAELARKTVTYGNQLLSAKENVPEGPVRDALQAVDLGEKLDQGAADWGQLRKDLEALLKKPEEPPPPEQPPPQQQQQQQQQKKQQDNASSGGNSDNEKSQGQDQQQQQQKQTQDQNASDKSQDPGQPPPAKQEENQAQSDAGNTQDENPPPLKSTASGQTQKVGGQADEQAKGPVDPSLTVPLQRLDELRNEDSPGTLYQRLDQSPPEKNQGKDW